ncbi:glutamate--cysteine ligase, partial [Amycolatopsis mediterranei]
LGIIERRCLARRTGATWQRDYVLRAQERGLDREAALSLMLGRYLELSESGEPVHTWPVAD